MTWGEFKASIESQGVYDYTHIKEIRWDDKDSPQVVTTEIRIN